MDGLRRNGPRRSAAGLGGTAAALIFAVLLGSASHAAGGEAGGTGSAAADEPPDPAADPVTEEAGGTSAIADDGVAAPEGDGASRAMIPRAAIVDMTRAQSALLCSSEIFLGCMEFDGRECLTLSESAIDQCLMTLPPEIDPTTLDNATLEACPREIYEQAGHDEERAQACLAEALEGS